MPKVIKHNVVETFTVEFSTEDIQFLGEVVNELNQANKIDAAIRVRKFIASITGNTLRGPYRKHKKEESVISEQTPSINQIG